MSLLQNNEDSVFVPQFLCTFNWVFHPLFVRQSQQGNVQEETHLAGIFGGEELVNDHSSFLYTPPSHPPEWIYCQRTVTQHGRDKWGSLISFLQHKPVSTIKWIAILPARNINNCMGMNHVWFWKVIFCLRVKLHLPLMARLKTFKEIFSAAPQVCQSSFWWKTKIGQVLVR